MILLLLLFWLFQLKLADAHNQKNRKNIAIIKWKKQCILCGKGDVLRGEWKSKAGIHHAGKQEFYCLSDALTGA